MTAVYTLLTKAERYLATMGESMEIKKLQTSLTTEFMTLPSPTLRLSYCPHHRAYSRCLSRLILFGEASLRHALTQYVEHLHHERNHQGKGNVLLFPAVSPDTARQGPIQRRERLGGLLKFYAREAA
jgi:hypothetical protein